MNESAVRNPFCVELRTGFNYDRKVASIRTGLLCTDPSRARQEFKEECDINTIVRDFGVTGTLPVGMKAPEYQDFEGVMDFQTAMQAVLDAQEVFDAIPAEVRREFADDPQRFFVYCQDEKNLPRLRELGLAVPEKGPAPPPEPILVRLAPGDAVPP